MTNSVGEVSSGLDIVNPAAGALTVDPAARLAVRFLAPAAALPHYGLAWAGDHVATLEAWEGDGRLVIEDAGLGGKTAEIFLTGSTTYVGLPPARGTMFCFQ